MLNLLLRAASGLVSNVQPLAVGATAPDVTATNQDGQLVNLGGLYKCGYVLVYFYPMAGTPGCTAQACSLRDSFDVLAQLNLTVVGVSHDSVAAQKKFALRCQLPFVLLSDPQSIIYNAFGVRGVARQSFLIKNGQIIWRELSASTTQQAAAVIKALAADRAKSSV
ncbi:MAG TPA: peroxiredoxin [Opitutales bacterium]|jgi:peroxiredoxin Q/BCP|nr:peroxiredoxin [Opitutales bacterium]